MQMCEQTIKILILKINLKIMKDGWRQREIVNNDKILFKNLVEWLSEQPALGEGGPDHGKGVVEMKGSLSSFQPKPF